MVLEHLLEMAEQPEAQRVSLRWTIIKAHVHLALVLAQLGNDDTAQREHTTWAANYLRKSPTCLSDSILKQILMRRDQPTHPVLAALGGAKWFAKRRPTQKADDHAQKGCSTCGMHDMQKPVFRCSQCQWTYYCSRECQRADWKRHKEACRDAFQSRKRVEQLKQENPEEATMAEDWINWRQAANSVDTEALYHALNLQRDPSRGRTHIVFRQAVYTPNDSKSIRKKFQVVNCGVYRIEDVLTDIEDFMDLNGGEGRAYIQGLIDELIEGDHTGDGVPILELKLAPGLEIYLCYLMSSRSKLRQITYNSHWRELMNPKSPPGPMPPLKSGAQDAEFRF